MRVTLTNTLEGEYSFLVCALLWHLLLETAEREVLVLGALLGGLHLRLQLARSGCQRRLVLLRLRLQPSYRLSSLLLKFLHLDALHTFSHVSAP